MISRKLRDEIDAVCPPDDRPRPQVARPVVTLEDVEHKPVKPPRINANYGRHDGVLTVRERIEAMLREHGPMAQREIFVRVWRSLGPAAKETTVRGQVTKAIEQLLLHEHIRPSDPPRDVNQNQIWWEVAS